MIKRKIGKITFGWDPNAYKGKGWWYVVGQNDGFARAASRGEAQRLGLKPKPNEEPPKDVATQKYYYTIGTTGRTAGKPVRRRLRTGSGYEEADIVRSKSLMQIASERMMAGEGLGKSLKGAIGDKIKAKGVNIKRKFDPMNLLSKLPGVGKLAATAWGKWRKRDPNDISYFTGIHAPPVNKLSKMEEEGEEKPKKSRALSKLFGGKTTTTKVGDNSTQAIKELHKLISDKFEEDKKLRETDDAFKEERKSEEDKRYENDKKDTVTRHKELIDAITKGMKPKKAEESKGLLGMLALGIGKFLLSLKDKFGSLIASIKELGPIFTNLASKFAGLLPELSSILVGALPLLALAAASKQAGEADLNKRNDGNVFTKTAQFGLTSFGNEDPAIKRAQGQYDEYAADVKAKKVPVKDEKDPTVQQWKNLGIKVDSNTLKGGKLDKLELTKEQQTAGAKSEQFRQNIDKKVAQEKETASKIVPEEEVKKLQQQKASFMETKKYFKTPEQIKSYEASLANFDRDIAKYSTAKPEAVAPSPLGSRADAATKENQNLVGPSASGGAPVIVNKTTNVVNNGGGSGGSSGGKVRNDEPILNRLQFQNVRPV